jgi:hypothetical protein
MGENAYGLLVGIPEGKRQLRTPRYRWEDNIEMDFTEIGWCKLNWISLAQDRDQWRVPVNTVTNFRVP